MKSDEQIRRYISLCQFQRNDWGRIVNYIRKDHKFTVFKPKYPIAKSSEAQFFDWMRDGFGAGDIVLYGNTVALVGYDVPGLIHLSACLLHGHVVNCNIDVTDDVHVRGLAKCGDIRWTDRVSAVSDEQAAGFLKQMRDDGLYFIPANSRVYNRFIPSVYEVCKYSGSRRGFGLVSKYDEENVHFLACIEGDALIKNMTLPIDETFFSPLTEDDPAFESMLKKNDVMIDYRKMKLVPYSNRVGFREQYWYIDDDMNVSSAIDYKTVLSDKRYNEGNYYVSIEDAIRQSLKLKERRRNPSL